MAAARQGLPTLRRAGGEWVKQRSGTFAWLHAVHFTDASRGWAVGGKGALLRTEDGGASWLAVASSPTEDTLRDVFFTDERTGWLVCERDIYKLKTEKEARSYLLKTEDGGATWKRVEAAGKDVSARLLRVHFAGPERGWTYGEEGALYATSDGGESWVRQTLPTRHLLLGGAFLDEQQGWVVGAGATFLYTPDGGATWRTGNIVSETALAAATTTDAARLISAATTQPRPRINAVSFIDSRRGWAVGSGGAVFQTINGGRSWRALRSHTDAALLDVKFFDDREGWASGSGGTLLHTYDGGVEWIQISTGTTHQLERLFFIDRAHGWAVGFGGTILSYFSRSIPQPEPKPLTRPLLRDRNGKPVP